MDFAFTLIMTLNEIIMSNQHDVATCVSQPVDGHEVRNVKTDVYTAQLSAAPL